MKMVMVLLPPSFLTPCKVCQRVIGRAVQNGVAIFTSSVYADTEDKPFTYYCENCANEVSHETIPTARP